MGRPPYPAVVRLLAIAQRHWAAIDGEAASRGADYLSLPFDRFLNAIYWWTVQRVKDPDRFVIELEDPLDGSRRREVTEADLAEDGASFLAFTAALGVSPRLPKPAPPADGDVPSSPST